MWKLVDAIGDGTAFAHTSFADLALTTRLFGNDSGFAICMGLSRLTLTSFTVWPDKCLASVIPSTYSGKLWPLRGSQRRSGRIAGTQFLASIGVALPIIQLLAR